MFRMTLALLVSLYAVMSIWGGPPANDVVVARADTFGPALGSLAGAASAGESATTRDDSRGDLSSVSAREAVELALAAGSAGETAALPQAASAAMPEVAAAADDARVAYVTGSRVNLRNGPTTKSAIVGSASRGDRTVILSDPAESWVRIRTDSGVEAWIYGRFLSETPA